MSIIDNQMLWRQFGAAIDSFGDALRAWLISISEQRKMVSFARQPEI